MRRLTGWVALAVSGVLLGACAVGPNYAPPPSPKISRLTNAPLPVTTVGADTVGGTVQHFRNGADIPGAWWDLFGSPELSALVTQALHDNPTLTAAQATLRAARETTRATQGAFFPTVSANASATRQQASLAAFGIPGGGTARFDLYSTGVNATYLLDVFGGVRRQVEEAEAQAAYDQAELEATYLTLTANLVGALLTEADLKAEVAATQEIIGIFRRELNMVQQRFNLGGVSKAEVLQQQASLAAQLALLPPLSKRLALQRDLVATYLGVLPAQYTAPTLDLAHLRLPAELPVSLPSQIVAQRPDIRAYAALLHAATANVGVATANMLPQFPLTASYGREGLQVSQMFTPVGVVWSLASGITQPLFEGGTLLHRRRAAVAQMEQAAAQYGSTVIAAFSNVADALVEITQDAETLRARVASERAARASLDMAQAQFQAGGTAYLNVLQAQQTYENAHLLLVGAQANRFIDTVALFQALGGGWWHRADVDPHVAQCCGVLPWTR